MLLPFAIAVATMPNLNPQTGVSITSLCRDRFLLCPLLSLLLILLLLLFIVNIP